MMNLPKCARAENMCHGNSQVLAVLTFPANFDLTKSVLMCMGKSKVLGSALGPRAYAGGVKLRKVVTTETVAMLSQKRFIGQIYVGKPHILWLKQRFPR